MTNTEKQLALLEHITDQHNVTDITRIPNNYYQQIKTLLKYSIAQTIAEDRERVKGEIEKIRKSYLGSENYLSEDGKIAQRVFEDIISFLSSLDKPDKE